MATLPANTKKKVPPIAFIAHVDTSPAVTGKNVKPNIHKKYRGGDIKLPKEGRVIKVSENPDLKGASSYAGIPLTHRGLAQGVTFLTGHIRDDEPFALDWSQLRDPNKTLLFYMGLANSEQIAQQLINAGRAATTPVAIVENASTPAQRRLIGTLAALPDLVTEHRVKAPALIIIGEVVRLAETLDWYTSSLQSYQVKRYAYGG